MRIIKSADEKNNIALYVQARNTIFLFVVRSLTICINAFQLSRPPPN